MKTDFNFADMTISAWITRLLNKKILLLVPIEIIGQFLL